ncbi:MAG: hypothetical protein QGD92_14535, partial [Gammaproteobacteria bacterium]|nr:hypothetical protein [Gammaproteobacteria bacterium]
IEETTDGTNDEPEETAIEEDTVADETNNVDASSVSDAPRTSEIPVSDDFLFNEVGISEISIDAPETTIIFSEFELLDENDNDESVARAPASIERMRSEYTAYSDPSLLMTSQQFLRGLDGVRDEVAIGIQAEQMVVGGGFALTTGLSVGYVVWLARSGILLSSLLTSLPAWQFMDPLPVLASMRDSFDDDTEDESLESIVESAAGESEMEDKPVGEVE